MSKELTIKVKFVIGEAVVFDIRTSKDEGVVSGYSLRQDNAISYAVVWSDKKESYHFDFELKGK